MDRQTWLHVSPSYASRIFPRSHSAAFAGHQRRLFSTEHPFVSEFNRLGIDEKIPARSDDDKPPISRMATGPKHSRDQFGRAERGNGLSLGEGQRTHPIERHPVRGMLCFYFHTCFPSLRKWQLPETKRPVSGSIKARKAGRVAPSWVQKSQPQIFRFGFTDATKTR